ncbi:MAG: hypothetical protein IT381_12220 [Deltaproteobacteria bacterium]|nr:hypothetical protein [Deltaproteobacteria bacterium]
MVTVNNNRVDRPVVPDSAPPEATDAGKVPEAAQQQPKAADAKSAARANETAKDSLSTQGKEGAGVKKGEAAPGLVEVPPRAPVTPEGTRLAAEGFAALSVALGGTMPPGEVAPFLGVNLKSLDKPCGTLSSLLSSNAMASALSAMNKLQSGEWTSAPPALMDSITLVTAELDGRASSISKKSFDKLAAPQQQAVNDVAKELSPILAASIAFESGEKKASKEESKASDAAATAKAEKSDRTSSGDKIHGVGGDRGGGAQDGDPSAGNAQRMTAGEAAIDGASTNRAGDLRNPSASGRRVNESRGFREDTHARAGLDPSVIELPGHDVITMERAIGSRYSLLAGGDVEELVNIVMMQVARDSETDLRDLIKEVQKRNAEKKQVREFIASAKKQEAAMNTQLRARYDERVALPAGNPRRIDPRVTSFDAFKDSQKIAMRAGGLASPDGEFLPPGDPAFSLSSRETLYAQSPEEARDLQGNVIPESIVRFAERLRVSPQQAMGLKRVWDGDNALQARFGSFERWLCETSANGGLGLRANPTQEQGPLIARFLQERDPVAVNRALATKFHVSLADLEVMRNHFDTKLNETQRAGGFEAWLKSSAGPGLTEAGSGEENSGKIERFCTQAEVDAAERRITGRFGISHAQYRALSDYFSEMQRTGNASGELEAWLTGTVGLRPGEGTANPGRVRDYMTQERARLTTPGAAPGAQPGNETRNVPAPYTATRTDGSSFSQEEAVAWINGCRTDAPLPLNQRNSDSNNIRLIVNQARGRVGLEADNIDNLLGDYLEEVLIKGHYEAHPNVDNHGRHGQDAASKWSALRDAINRLPEGQRQAAANYVQLRMAEVRRDVEIARKCDGTAMERKGGGTPAAAQDPWLVERGIVYCPWAHGQNHVRGLDGAYNHMDEAAWQRAANNVNLTPDWGSATPGTRPPEPHGPPAPGPSAATDPANAGRMAVLDRFANGGYTTTITIGAIFIIPGVTGGGAGGGSTTPTPLGNPSAEVSAAMAAMRQEQASGGGVVGRESAPEMTLAQLRATIEEWEGKKDTLGDLSEQLSLKLQMYQDRRAKMYSTLSNILKKNSETSSQIISNLK